MDYLGCAVLLCVHVYNSQELLASLGLCPEHRPSSQCCEPASRLGAGSEGREGGREGGGGR